VSKREQDGLPEMPLSRPQGKDSQVIGAREGRVELPRPFGHRILRLLQPGTDPGTTCRPVSSGATQCHPVSFRREQGVSGTVACIHVHPDEHTARSTRVLLAVDQELREGARFPR
jgi:hypothetical protein